MMRPDAAL